MMFRSLFSSSKLTASLPQTPSAVGRQAVVSQDSLRSGFRTPDHNIPLFARAPEKLPIVRESSGSSVSSDCVTLDFSTTETSFSDSSATRSGSATPNPTSMLGVSDEELDGDNSPLLQAAAEPTERKLSVSAGSSERRQPLKVASFVPVDHPADDHPAEKDKDPEAFIDFSLSFSHTGPRRKVRKALSATLASDPFIASKQVPEVALPQSAISHAVNAEGKVIEYNGIPVYVSDSSKKRRMAGKALSQGDASFSHVLISAASPILNMPEPGIQRHGNPNTNTQDVTWKLTEKGPGLLSPRDAHPPLSSSDEVKRSQQDQKGEKKQQKRVVYSGSAPPSLSHVIEIEDEESLFGEFGIEAERDSDDEGAVDVRDTRSLIFSVLDMLKETSQLDEDYFPSDEEPPSPKVDHLETKPFHLRLPREIRNSKKRHSTPGRLDLTLVEPKSEETNYVPLEGKQGGPEYDSLVKVRYSLSKLAKKFNFDLTAFPEPSPPTSPISKARYRNGERKSSVVNPGWKLKESEIQEYQRRCWRRAEALAPELGIELSRYASFPFYKSRVETSINFQAVCARHHQLSLGLAQEAEPDDEDRKEVARLFLAVAEAELVAHKLGVNLEMATERSRGWILQAFILLKRHNQAKKERISEQALVECVNAKLQAKKNTNIAGVTGFSFFKAAEPCLPGFDPRTTSPDVVAFFRTRTPNVSPKKVIGSDVIRRLAV